MGWGRWVVGGVVVVGGVRCGERERERERERRRESEGERESD